MLLRTACRSRPSPSILHSSRRSIIASRALRTRTGRSEQQSISKAQQSTPSDPKSASDDQGQSASSTKQPDVSSTLASIDPSQNELLAPVHIPADPNAVLRDNHPATNLLAQSGLVVTRQIEMMNIFLGFEQANKYVIMDPQGNHVGYMAEHDGGIAKAMGRQWFRTHRSFTTHVFDKHAREVLRFHRPFSWINSTIRVYDPLEVGKYAPQSASTEVSTNVKDTTIDGLNAISDLPIESMRVIGEAHSEWAPLRRKYNLFLAHELEGRGLSEQSIGSEHVPSDLSPQQKQMLRKQDTNSFAQFAYVDEPFLSWDFSLKSADGHPIGGVSKQFRGFGREIFTDTNMYMLRMDSAALEDAAERLTVSSADGRTEKAYAEAVGGTNDTKGLTLDQRAIMLATAVTLDFDYFSRHSRAGGGGFMPIWLMGGGGEAAGGAAGGAAEAGAAGAGTSEAGGAVIGGTAGRGMAGAAGTASEIGAGEGAIAGAGTMAGYEAMQRGMGRNQEANDSPPPSGQPGEAGDPNSPQYGGDYGPQETQDGWGQDQQSGDVWGSGNSDPWSGGQEGGSAGEGGGGGIFSQLWDAFFGD